MNDKDYIPLTSLQLADSLKLFDNITHNNTLPTLPTCVGQVDTSLELPDLSELYKLCVEASNLAGREKSGEYNRG